MAKFKQRFTGMLALGKLRTKLMPGYITCYVTDKMHTLLN